MITFEHVTATYKKNKGIFNVSFDVQKGEMVFIMGPTGAGKSTVLKTIYKDVNVNSGNIILDKQNVSKIKSVKKISELRRKIGMIFQDFKLLNDRTVLENVALPLRIMGLPTEMIYNKIKVDHCTIIKLCSIIIIFVMW